MDDAINLRDTTIKTENAQADEIGQSIAVEVIGPYTARGNGVMVTSEKPLASLCQILVESGIESFTPLEVFRDNVLISRGTVGAVAESNS